MASGDRIELLTADAFESAMSTVAKESTVNTCAAKVDNVDADIAALAATINSMNNSVAADYQLDQTIHNVLADLYNNRIGVTNNTGGTAAAGTVMAKLNTIINNVTSSKQSSIESVAPNKIRMSNWIEYTGSQTIINVTGSGTLYSVLVRQPSNMIIKVDGNIIYNGSYSGTAYTEMGLVSMPFISYDSSLRCLFPSYSLTVGNYTFNNGVYTPSLANQPSQVFTPPLPIKFSSSLVVTITKNTAHTATGYYGCAYILD